MTGLSLFDFDDSPFALEESLSRQNFVHVAGIDEAGRGALAGPVVAAAAILRPSAKCLIGRVRDSKQIPEPEREELFPLVIEHCVSYGVGVVHANRIDEVNILRATLEAMRLAVEQLSPSPDLCLTDGNVPAPIPHPQRTIVKGDHRVFSIAAASILAKVTRDRWMAQAAIEWPSFGWDRNKGYGTAEHLRELKKVGPTPYHRRSFAPAR